MRPFLGSAFLLVAIPLGLSAQVTDSLGLKLGQVPDVLAAHIGQLPKNALLVQEAPSESVGFQGGLRRHDVILGINGKIPNNAADALAKLRDGANKRLVLSIVRQGKERMLVFAQPSADGATKSFLKPGGLPAVTVQAQPQKDGQLAVTIFFYTDKSSKLERLTCKGPAEDIERQFHDLAAEKQVPENIQDLVDVALRRLRELNPSKQKN